MSGVTVFGASYSVYVRIVRLALELKGVPYDLEEVNIFAEDGPPQDHLARHPFAKIPAFRHDDFDLYETAAIVRYVDRAFPGDPLSPPDPRDAARMDQIVSIFDNYAYRGMVWGVYVEAVSKPANGEAPDDRKVAEGLAIAEICRGAVADLAGDGSWLVGRTITLADLYAIR